MQAVRFRENGEPVDLTGYTGACQVRTAPDGGELVTEVGVVIDAAEGYVELQIPADRSAELRSGRYVYDFCMESAEGIRTCFFGGLFRVVPAVTERSGE